MKNTILVVDDEKGIRDGLKAQLEGNGFEVFLARNGEEALKVYNDSRPDLVLLDVMMPKMDGFTVCRTIRKADTITPIVFLTCKDSEIDQVKAFEFGAVDFIRKSDLNSSAMTEAVFLSSAWPRWIPRCLWSKRRVCAKTLLPPRPTCSRFSIATAANARPTMR